MACAGEAVTMVALGGSITAGQGVSVPADAYIARFYAWVQARISHCAVLAIWLLQRWVSRGFLRPNIGL